MRFHIELFQLCFKTQKRRKPSNFTRDQGFFTPEESTTTNSTLRTP